MHFVYIGNIPGHVVNNTYPPNRGEKLIDRAGFAVREYHLQGGACAFCGEAIPGVWWRAEPQGQAMHLSPGPPDR